MEQFCYFCLCFYLQTCLAAAVHPQLVVEVACAKCTLKAAAAPLHTLVHDGSPSSTSSSSTSSCSTSSSSGSSSCGNVSGKSSNSTSSSSSSSESGSAVNAALALAAAPPWLPLPYLEDEQLEDMLEALHRAQQYQQHQQHRHHQHHAHQEQKQSMQQVHNETGQHCRTTTPQQQQQQQQQEQQFHQQHYTHFPCHLSLLPPIDAKELRKRRVRSSASQHYSVAQLPDVLVLHFQRTRWDAACIAGPIKVRGQVGATSQPRRTALSQQAHGAGRAYQGKSRISRVGQNHIRPVYIRYVW